VIIVLPFRLDQEKEEIFDRLIKKELFLAVSAANITIGLFSTRA